MENQLLLTYTDTQFEHLSRWPEVKQYYDNLIRIYEQFLKPFTFKKLIFNEYQVVYIIEEKFIVFMGLQSSKEFLSKILYLELSGETSCSILKECCFIIEELTPNNIFTFSAAELKRKADKQFICNYKHFGMYNGNEVHDYVLSRYPYIPIDELNKDKDWSRYYFYYYKISVNKKSAFCICFIKKPAIPSDYAYAKLYELDDALNILYIHHLQHEHVSNFTFRGILFSRRCIKLVKPYILNRKIYVQESGSLCFRADKSIKDTVTIYQQIFDIHEGCNIEVIQKYLLKEAEQENRWLHKWLLWVRNIRFICYCHKSKIPDMTGHNRGFWYNSSDESDT